MQKLQVARRELSLEAAINRLDNFDLLILDDITYVSKDQAETSVLFELISARYERRSLLITANQPFGEWGKIFPDPAMTLAAVDRLVHHATLFEMNVESFRRRTAVNRKHNGQGRPASYATPKNVGLLSPSDNQPENELLPTTNNSGTILSPRHPETLERIKCNQVLTTVDHLNLWGPVGQQVGQVLSDVGVLKLLLYQVTKEVIEKLVPLMIVTCAMHDGVHGLDHQAWAGRDPAGVEHRLVPISCPS